MKLNVRLDICTLCNLNCPACGMRKANYGEVKAGYLKFETFKTFIENNNIIQSIEISNAGEPLLNPEVISILKYAYEKNIDIYCNNGTTLNFQNNKILEALVDYKVKSIIVAIDGVTQDCYEKYRRNGNINLVFKNLNYLLNYKKQKNSRYPEIIWQYIIMENTEDKKQIEKAKQIAQELHIPLRFKLTWDRKYTPKNEDELKTITGLQAVTRASYKNITHLGYKTKTKCCQLWSCPQINWDGRLLGCCKNQHPFNINVFDLGKNGLIKALVSDEYIAAKSFLQGEDTNFITPCHKCSIKKEISNGDRLETYDILKIEETLKNLKMYCEEDQVK